MVEKGEGYALQIEDSTSGEGVVLYLQMTRVEMVQHLVRTSIIAVTDKRRRTDVAGIAVSEGWLKY
jgi:hypothetical protein